MKRTLVSETRVRFMHSVGQALQRLPSFLSGTYASEALE